MGMQQRGIAARIGVSALNIITPGLGLLRVGKLHLALAAIGLSVAINGGVAAYYALGAELTFRTFAILAGITITYLLLVGLGAILLTFRYSKVKSEQLSPWSRWYVLLLIGIASFVLSMWLLPPIDAYYRSFSIPARSMEPALQVGDRFVASMRLEGAPERGDIVIVRRGPVEYVKRIAGLPGDRIGLEGGEVRLNGKPARYEYLPESRPSVSCDVGKPRMTREWLGAGSRPTIIADCGYGLADDFPDVVIPRGHYFLLGDNRDQSADSRFDEQQFGLGMVPAHDIIGRALFIYWSKDRSRIGRPVE